MNIAIWGLGKSGHSALNYLRTTEHQLFVINMGEVDSWGSTVSLAVENCFEQNESLKSLELDQIILSPGVDRKHELVKHFIDLGVEVISEVELAFRNQNLPLIAITGTNGKTTTTTLIQTALEMSGKKVFCGGNIGTPFCDMLTSGEAYDIAVLELSSFQLESMPSFHANIAIILNINESHMERYNHFHEYEGAKLNIANNQTEKDLIIAPQKYLEHFNVQQKSPIEKLMTLDMSTSKLVGEHHRENLFCVEKTLEFLQIQDAHKLTQDLANSFAGVEFRLQFIAKKNGLEIFNDAKSTNPFATQSAILSLGERDITLIMGGKLRSDKIELKDTFKDLKTIKKIFAIGEARHIIESELSEFFDVQCFETLSDVIRDFNKGEGCLLFSPGFPSFDQYNNYTERGKDFNYLVTTAWLT